MTEVSLLSREEQGAERSLERGGWVGILEIQSPTGMSRLEEWTSNLELPIKKLRRSPFLTEH